MKFEIVKGRVLQPDRILVYGRPGVGKSTFASGSPSPLFIDVERGSYALAVDRLHPDTLEEFLSIIRNWPTEYRTCVIDTLDALERLVFRVVCKEMGVDAIESIGYGKGYAKAVDRWNDILAALDGLRYRHGVEVILLAHSIIRNVTNPAGTDYTRHELAVNAKAVGTLTAWVDTLAFADIEHSVTKDEKIISSGRRVLRLASGAWDAKCRMKNAPEQIENSYAAYSAMRSKLLPAASEASTSVVGSDEAVDAASLEKTCRALAAKVSDANTQKTILAHIETIVGNQEGLQKTLARLQQITRGN